jgi:hypothetical protein
MSLTSALRGCELLDERGVRARTFDQIKIERSHFVRVPIISHGKDHQGPLACVIHELGLAL